MDLLHAAVLGIVQGLTEFLPISSSGHLIFVPKFLGWPDQGLAFDVTVHVATLLAIVIYLRKRLWGIITALYFQDPKHHHERNLALLLAISTVPALIVGFFLNSLIEKSFRSPLLVAVNLIFWGIALWLAELYSKTQFSIGRGRNIPTLNIKNALWIGLAQAISLVPGTSRSGITISAGFLARLDKRSATEFSFLMSVPIIAIAGADKLLELFQSGFNGIGIAFVSVGFLSALLGGLLAIWMLLKVIDRWNFLPFVVYRIIVGLLIIFLLVL